MRNVVLYGRISVLDKDDFIDGEKKKDSSVDTQLLKLRSYVDYQNKVFNKNFHIYDEIIDDGFSGGSTKRPGYQKILGYIKRKEIGAVIVSNVARLSRSVKDFLDFIELCGEYDVNLVLMDQELDTTTSMGKAMMTIFVALAELEKDQASERVKSNCLAKLLAHGKLNGSCEVLGLDHDEKNPGQYLENKEEVKRLVSILKVYVKLENVPGTWREVKDKIMGKNGKPLSKYQVQKIIDNCEFSYRGLWPANTENKDKAPENLEQKYRYQIIELSHGPIVDIELLDEVIRIRNKKRHKSPRRVGKNGYVYPLAQLIVDEEGNEYKGEPAKGGQYRYYKNKKTGERIPLKKLEAIVLKKLKEVCRNSKRFSELFANAFKKKDAEIPEVQRNIRALKAAIKEHEEKREDALKRFDPSEYSDPKKLEAFIENLESCYTKEIKTFEKELAYQEGLLQKYQSEFSESKLRATIKKFLDGIQKMSREVQRVIYQKFIKNIIVREHNQLEIQIYGDHRKKRKKNPN